MKPTRKVSRRSFLGTVAGGLAGAGALAIMSGTANAQVTDSDSGPNSDQAGRGRGNGVTDSDSGPNSDQPGAGRGSRGGVTDSDRGPNSDQAGAGRGNRRRRTRPCSDSDQGPNSDPANIRRCR
jgi:hypothetical protein